MDSETPDSTQPITITPLELDHYQIQVQTVSPYDALATLLDGILALAQVQTGGGEGTIAQAFRAEASDLTALVPCLIASVFVDLDDEIELVESLQLDGVIRTDDGFAAWGYAFLGEVRRATRVPTVADVAVETSRQQTTLTATIQFN